MSLDWLRYGWGPDGPSDPDDRYMLMILAGFVPPGTDTAFPSLPSIMQRSRLSKFAVKRRIASLERAGYIFVVRGCGAGKASIYTFRKLAEKGVTDNTFLDLQKGLASEPFSSTQKGLASEPFSKQKRVSGRTKKGLVGAQKRVSGLTPKGIKGKDKGKDTGNADALPRHRAAMSYRTRSQPDQNNRARWSQRQAFKEQREIDRLRDNFTCSRQPTPEEIDRQEAAMKRRVASRLETVAEALTKATIAEEACREAADQVRAEIADVNRPGYTVVAPLEDMLKRIEEKLVAEVTSAAPEELIAKLKEQAAREFAGRRNDMTAASYQQVKQQFIQKQLLAHYRLPRMSLFYMQ